VLQLAVIVYCYSCIVVTSRKLTFGASKNSSLVKLEEVLWHHKVETERGVTKVKTIQSSPIQPNPTQPNPTQPNPTQPSPAQSNPAQSNPAPPNPTQSSPAQPNPIQSSRTCIALYALFFKYNKSHKRIRTHTLTLTLRSYG
jgi:hypothetical protein